MGEVLSSPLYRALGREMKQYMQGHTARTHAQLWLRAKPCPLPHTPFPLPFRLQQEVEQTDQFFGQSCSPSQSNMQSTYYTQDGAMFKPSRKHFDSSSMTLIKASIYTQKHTHVYTPSIMYRCEWRGRVAICCVPEGPQTAPM